MACFANGYVYDGREPVGLIPATTPDQMCAECNGRTVGGLLVHNAGCPAAKRSLSSAAVINALSVRGASSESK